MATRRDVDRRDVDRRGHDRDFDTRRHPTTSSRPQLNEYWIAGEGINRQVLQTEICKYLGAEATCRPGDYQGVPGYKIKALRPFTPDMLDDLRSASSAFSNENRAYMKRNDRELAYTDSRAFEQTNGPDYQDAPRPYATRDSPAYPIVTSGPNYSSGPVSSGSGFPSGFSGASSSSAYPPHAATSQAPFGGQDPYAAHHSSRRGDTDMRDAPSSSYANGYPHSSAPHHPSGPAYDYPQRGDPRAGGYGNEYASNPYGGQPPRGPPQGRFDDSMSGLSGPGASYGGGPSRGNAMPAYQGGYDSYDRAGAHDSRYASGLRR